VDTSIEVRYAGVVVGRTSHAREEGAGMFVGISEPLPVGTLVTLKMGDALREARVAEVVEAADPSSVGMRVTFDVGARAASAAPAPAQVVASAAPPVQDGPSAAVAAEAEASEAISAPLSLAEPGGGKRRKKRR
jgi:hypothetical protein